MGLFEVFKGRFDLVLTGTMGGRPWSQISPGAKPLQFKQYQRTEDGIDLPPEVVIKTVKARVYDDQGAKLAEQTARP